LPVLSCPIYLSKKSTILVYFVATPYGARLLSRFFLHYLVVSAERLSAMSRAPVRTLRVGHYCRVATKGELADHKLYPEKEIKPESVPENQNEDEKKESPSKKRKELATTQIDPASAIYMDYTHRGNTFYVQINEGPYRRHIIWRYIHSMQHIITQLLGSWTSEISSFRHSLPRYSYIQFERR